MSPIRAAAIAVLFALMLYPKANLADEAATPRVRPKISVFVNESKVILVLKGWPLIVRVAVEYPDPPPERRNRPIVLEAAEDWSDIVRVEVRDAQEKTCDWAFAKITPAATRPRLELGPGSGETVSFVISPKQTKELAAGLYKITALIVGFKGPSESDALVRIMDHPESLTPQGEEARGRFIAMYRALTGEEAPAPRAAPAAARPVAAPRPPPQPTQPPQPPPGEPQASGGAVAAEILSVVGSAGYGDFVDPYYSDWAAPDDYYDGE